jgi:hypothetical protein
MNRISQWMMSIAVVLISNLILSSRAPAQSLTTLYSFGGARSRNAIPTHPGGLGHVAL